MFFLEMLSKMASKKFLEGPSMLLTKCLESTNENKNTFFLSFLISSTLLINLPNSILHYYQLFVYFYFFEMC